MPLKQYLQQQELSKSTIACYMRHNLEYITFLDQENIELENSTAKELTAFLGKLKKKGIQSTTQNIYLNAIKHLYNYQIKQQKRENNPAARIKLRGIKRKHIHTILSKEELSSLESSYKLANPEDERNKRNWWKKYELGRKRNKVILSLMVNQGLTTAEISKLEEQDLQLEEGKLTITESRKSAERTLDLKSHQMMALMKYHFTTLKEIKAHTSKQTNKLFPALGSAEDSSNLWKSLTKELKEKHQRFNNFKQVRASVITHWLGQHNLRQVQYMAGHKYISSTEKYKIGQLEDLQSDIDEFHPI